MHTHTIKYYDAIPFENGGGDTPVSNGASRTPDVKWYSREQMESAIEHFSKYVEKYGFIPSTELVNMYLSGI